MGGNQLLLTFSAPVNFNDQAPYIAIRLVDPNALGVQMDASQSEYLQVSGSLSAGADKTQYIWTAARRRTAFRHRFGHDRQNGCLCALQRP